MYVWVPKLFAGKEDNDNGASAGGSTDPDRDTPYSRLLPEGTSSTNYSGTTSPWRQARSFCTLPAWTVDVIPYILHVR